MEPHAAPLSHVVSEIIPDDFIARWKVNFNNLNIPKAIYLNLLVDWAQEMGYTTNHALHS